MTAKAIRNRRFEDQYQGSRVPVMVLAAVAFFGLAFLLTYICIVPPVDGTGMGAIKNVMNGLGGSVAVLLPLVLAWIGVLCVGRARGLRVSALRVAADALLRQVQGMEGRANGDVRRLTEKIRGLMED